MAPGKRRGQTESSPTTPPGQGGGDVKSAGCGAQKGQLEGWEELCARADSPC